MIDRPINTPIRTIKSLFMMSIPRLFHGSTSGRLAHCEDNIDGNSIAPCAFNEFVIDRTTRRPGPCSSRGALPASVDVLARTRCASSLLRWIASFKSGGEGRPAPVGRWGGVPMRKPCCMAGSVRRADPNRVPRVGLMRGCRARGVKGAGTTHHHPHPPRTGTGTTTL